MEKIKYLNHMLLSLSVTMLLLGCTLPPLAFENDAQSQNVNSDLVCAQEIELFPVSINGVNPPKEAFDLYLKKLKKYTTDNVTVHETMDLIIEEDKIDDFVQSYGMGAMHLYDLADKDKDKFVNFRKKTMKLDSAIVMIYTPKLLCNFNKERKLRGRAFAYSSFPNVVAYNATTINDAPVISDTQAWKIVLTHEVGHCLGVPAKKTHNKAGHCTSRECIMYARPDWQAVVSVIFNGMPYDFCDKCKAELLEAKKKCSDMYEADSTIYTKH